MWISTSDVKTFPTLMEQAKFLGMGYTIIPEPGMSYQAEDRIHRVIFDEEKYKLKLERSMAALIKKKKEQALRNGFGDYKPGCDYVALVSAIPGIPMAYSLKGEETTYGDIEDLKALYPGSKIELFKTCGN